MINELFFFLCAIPAVLIFGVAKGGFGGIIGIVSVPLMALAVSPAKAAAILLPILCVMDVLAVYKFRGQWHRENLRIMLPAALVGVVLGALTFKYISEAHVRLLIGVLALIFALNYWLGTSKRAAAAPCRLKGWFWSLLAGFTSFGIHAGGPPASAYLVPQRLPPTLFLGTSALLFAVINYAKLIPYFWLGQLNMDNLMTSLILLPLAPIGIGIGYYLHKRISVSLFYGVFNVFLVLTGLKLLYDGFVTL
ncbi:sulfite exporter TauE/SafE family protein [Marinobacterium rhizophilum]|uniref:sulfite exporter TauE/SafE family protein n=1 Tax=Marinobacterium rhizophilum TaxID=420402 RepID=UPI000363F9CE|nr:sulfite exporter TauE/SafE family protein [Marinobacterium rhizophilum]